MNEQFKQISLMAGGSHYPSINPDLQQKFGELIVEECVKICDLYGMPDGTSPAAMIIALAIKNRFGMEQ